MERLALPRAAPGLRGCHALQRLRLFRTAAAASPRKLRSADVLQQDVKLYGEWVATLDGFVNAQIQPQVTGYLIKQDYREGTLVHKGDVLFEIDPRPFQAALDLARRSSRRRRRSSAMPIST